MYLNYNVFIVQGSSYYFLRLYCQSNLRTLENTDNIHQVVGEPNKIILTGVIFDN